MLDMDALDNLVKIKKLNKELPDQREFDGMVSAAVVKLQDASLAGLSEDSRFSLAYGAAHALALAALRWHGYRSDSRYLVFQCLLHTLNMDNANCRVLDECHRRRNMAEYEGHLDVDSRLIQELLGISHEMLDLVRALGQVQNK
jgi:hypothetical protein